MMKKFCGVLLAYISLAVPGALSDDIEIYLNGTAGSGAPYVHLMLDYRPSVFSSLCTIGSSCNVVASNGSCPSGICFTQAAYDLLPGGGVTRFDAFVAVMGSIFGNELFEGIYMALLVSNFNNGGTLLEGYKLLGGDYITLDPTDVLYEDGDVGYDPNNPLHQTGAEKLIATMKAIPIPSNNSSVHKLQPKESYFEWYRYLNGGSVIYGDETDDNFNAARNVAPVPNYDASIMVGPGNSSASYISPFTDPNSCSKLFSIAVAMNASNQDDSLDNTINNAQYSGLGVSTNGSYKFDDFLDDIHRSTMDLVSGINGVQPLEKTWIISDSGSIGATRSWAVAGGSGSPLDIDDPVQLEADLLDAFGEIISVSSTFVAASVPVNVFNRAESLDNLFIALFEAQATQHWPGNIKKLKLSDTTGDGAFDDIVDVNGDPGFETTGSNRGRISFNALTYWTDSSTLPSAATLTTDPNNPAFVPTGVDGRVVDRGGAGQKIPNFVANTVGNLNTDTNARQLYLEPSSVTNGASNALDAFNVDSATITTLQGELGVTALVAGNLIRWGRGQDVDDFDGDSNTTETRQWILSDAIHSRPLAVNYGTQGGYSTTNPNIRLFFGSGEGAFHIVENTTTAVSNNESGKEIFGFYPREMLDLIGERRANTNTSSQMRYGIDGPAAVFASDINKDGNLDYAQGDEVYVYFGLRRGGSSYFALDVSNPSTVPKLKWKITKTTGGNFDELGLTFSRPVAGKVRYGSSTTDVLIFAGGYNGGWNTGYTARVGKDLNDNDDVVGNAVYIVDARTGALIWKAVKGAGTASATVYQHVDLDDSIPSDVTVLKDKNGVIHRLYVGDTGGAVWRVDLPPGSGTNYRQSNWFITKFAEMGTDGTATDRRFFHAPDIVETFDGTGNFDGILISSGGRADPLETSVTNYHLYLKDRLIVSGAAAVKARESSPGPFVLTDISDRTLCVIGTESACSTSTVNGWRVRLIASGEKGLSSALVDGGRVFMSTYVPPSGANTCAPTEGDGFVYIMNLKDATAVSNNQRFYDVGAGIPSEWITLGDQILCPGGCDIPVDPNSGEDPNDPPCSGKLCKSLTKTMHRIYWREPGIDDL